MEAQAQAPAAVAAQPNGGSGSQQDVQQDHHQQKQQQQQQQRQQHDEQPQGAAAAASAAAILRQACDLLALPTRVVTTALTYLHRLQPAEREELPPERLAAAALFLAAKTEEAAVRTNDMLNAVAAWRPAAAGAGAALAAFPCLVGGTYAAAKAQLIADEQLLLRRLRFDICADQPHRHLYALARCWGASGPAVRVATCLLNDCVLRCPGYGSPAMPPATAAAATLHVGAQLCHQAVQPSGWWRATGVGDAAMRDACAALLDLMEQQQPAAAQQPTA